MCVVYPILLRPGSGGVLRSACLFVCLCVCLSFREHISGTAGPIFTNFLCTSPCGRGSVLPWRRCDKLCTSGFMDDVTFGRSGPYGDALRYCTGAESDLYECLIAPVTLTLT